jgi:DNA-directed RNA polymerase subunit H (RpoH/RPB5)
MEKVLLNVTKMLSSRKFLDEQNIEENHEKLLNQVNEERIFKIKSDYDDKYYHIMFVYGKITTIKKIQGLDTFLQLSNGQNRLFIADNINQKAYKQFIELNNTEIFFEYELLINIIDHDLQPKFEVLDVKEKKDFLEEYDITKRQMSKMRSIDPIARYYNIKAGDIVRIVRPSSTSGLGFHYRIVIDSHPSEIFEKK